MSLMFALVEIGGFVIIGICLGLGWRLERLARRESLISRAEAIQALPDGELVQLDPEEVEAFLGLREEVYGQLKALQDKARSEQLGLRIETRTGHILERWRLVR